MPVHVHAVSSALLFIYHLSVSFALSSLSSSSSLQYHPHHPSIVIIVLSSLIHSNSHGSAVPAMSRFGRIHAERGHGQVAAQAAVAACSPSSRSNDNEHKQS